MENMCDNETLRGIDGHLSVELSTAVGIYMVFIGVSGAVLNGMFLITWLRIPALKTPMSIFFVNLALGDFVSSVVAIPMTAISSFKVAWFFGDEWCKVYGFLCFLIGNITIQNLTAISIDRYLRVRRPFSVFCLNTISKAVAANVVIWLYGIMWSTFPLVGWSAYRLEPQKTLCSVDWYDNSPSNVSYIIAIFLAAFVIPLSVISYCYISIVIWFRQRNCRFAKVTTRANKCAKSAENKMTIISVVMVCAFLVCWTPYAVVSFMGTFRLYSIHNVQWSIFAPVLAKSIVVINPLVYYCTNDDLRRAIFTCDRRLRKTHVESTSLTATSERIAL